MVCIVLRMRDIGDDRLLKIKRHRLGLEASFFDHNHNSSSQQWGSL